MAIRPSSLAIADFLRKIDEHISFAILYCSVIPIVIIVILVVMVDSKAEAVVPCRPLKQTQASSFGLKVRLEADFRN